MRNLITLACFGILAALISVSCSQKYEPPVGPTTDTLTLRDTIVDTVFQPGDTVYIDTSRVDTVIIIKPGDTVTVTDTVYVPIDTNGASEFCNTISGTQKTITWLLSRVPDSCLLTFRVSTGKDQPPQSVTVTVDGIATVWPIASQPTLILRRLLGKSEIHITSNKAHAFGHDFTICLLVEPL